MHMCARLLWLWLQCPPLLTEAASCPPPIAGPGPGCQKASRPVPGHSGSPSSGAGVLRDGGKPDTVVTAGLHVGTSLLAHFALVACVRADMPPPVPPDASEAGQSPRASSDPAQPLWPLGRLGVQRGRRVRKWWPAPEPLTGSCGPTWQCQAGADLDNLCLVDLTPLPTAQVCKMT